MPGRRITHGIDTGRNDVNSVVGCAKGPGALGQKGIAGDDGVGGLHHATKAGFALQAGPAALRIRVALEDRVVEIEEQTANAVAKEAKLPDGREEALEDYRGAAQFAEQRPPRPPAPRQAAQEERVVRLSIGSVSAGLGLALAVSGLIVGLMVGIRGVAIDGSIPPGLAVALVVTRGLMVLGMLAFGCGLIFQLTPPGNGTQKWRETVLYEFTGKSDGNSPAAGLLFDSAGTLYGTTQYGGDLAACPVLPGYGDPGCGVIFKLTPSTGGTWQETVLHTFTGGFDGGSPNAGLAQNAAGNIYGTTAAGGTSGQGVVFKLDTTGKLTVLHAFTGGSDGGNPDSVVLDGAGHLYGTAATGGGRCRDQGCGVVFKITP